MLAQKQERILRMSEVTKKIGVSKSTIYQWVKEGQFPKQIHMGPRSSGWLESDVEEWIESRAQQRICD